MQVTKKTGSLDIEGERRGRIHFVDGAVTGAELHGERGTYQGTDRPAVADILYVLSTLEDGSFRVGPADGPDGDSFAVEDVLDEVAALRSLEGEVIDAGLFEAPAVRLVRDLEEAITMEPEDWQIVVALVQPFTFQFLESRVGRGGAVRIFHTLHRLGVAEAMAGDDESQWLDQLAGGLIPQSSVAPVPERPSEETARHVAPDPEVEKEVATGVAAPVQDPVTEGVRGVSADASTTLTDGVYDEIRRLRSKATEGK